MKIVNGKEVYERGDRVRIVSKWDEFGRCCQNCDGEMDKYLGTIMTVRSKDGPNYRMMEDVNDNEWQHGWYWNKYCIEGLADPDVEELDFVSILEDAV